MVRLRRFHHELGHNVRKGGGGALTTQIVVFETLNLRVEAGGARFAQRRAARSLLLVPLSSVAQYASFLLAFIRVAPFVTLRASRLTMCTKTSGHAWGT